MAIGVSTKRERVLIGIGVVVVGVCAWLMLNPDTGSKSLLPASEARTLYSSAAGELRALRGDTDRIRPAMRTMVYSGSADVVVPQVVQEVQRMAADARVHLRELKPLRQRKLGDLAKQALTVRFSCAFRDAIPFLYRLEDAGGKLVIDKLNVAASDPKSKTVDVELQLGFFTHMSTPVNGALSGTRGTREVG